SYFQKVTFFKEGYLLKITLDKSYNMEYDSNISDSELTEAIRLSDEAAFEALYNRYYKSVYRFLWSRTQSTESAKELAQETFIRLWQNRQSLDSRKSIKAYMYRIGINLLLNDLRKRKIHKTYINEQRDIRSSGNIELQTRIHLALQKLPEKIRTVFILNQLEGFKYAEIAETLGVSSKTVEKRMAKALRMLREQL
ncbi:MAG: RNA polymerase sigma-70 factor, partial [bacterium]